jgi:diaminohydroxyphosphoribosylaminopyrimidine deaminase/5-amino-6-(5-phosphoribosylamino)uracil reductase
MNAEDADGPSDKRGIDDHFMAAALRLAQRGLGNVWPNPAVGCIIVDMRGDRPVVLGRGWTQPGGRPHAETVALDALFRRRGKDAARGATVFVSLEPCSHQGRTPPCADALISAGVARVVLACEDPDPRVSGRGVARLREAGIDVLAGVCQAAAEALNAGFFRRVSSGEPLVTWKTATSLDGRIATVSGHSQWITSEMARAHAHLERARHDAILIGLGTAISDDPQLTCRLPGLGARSPVRVVLDSRLRLPLTARLVSEAGSPPTWLVTRDDNDPVRLQALRDLGVDVIEVPPDTDQRLDLHAALRALGDRGITRLLVEGGARVATALIASDAVDRILWYRAPRLIGGDGLSAIVGFGLDDLAEAPRFERIGLRALGEDRLEIYRRCR